MPANYDGDIKLSVSLDPKSVVKSAEELTHKISKIFEASEGRQSDAGFKKILASMDKTNSKAVELKDRLQELLEQQEKIDEAKSAQGDPNRLKNLEELIEKFDLVYKYGSAGNLADTLKLPIPEGMDFYDYAEQITNEYESINANIKEFGNVSDEEYAKLVNDINEAKAALAQLNNEMRVSTDSVAFKNITAQPLQGVIDQALKSTASVNDLETAIDQIGERLMEISDTDSSFLDNAEYQQLSMVLKELESRYFAVADAEQQLSDTELEEANAVANLAQAVRNVIAEENSLKHKMAELASVMGGIVAGQFISPFQKLSNSISNIGKSATTADFSMKKMFRTFLRYGLGVRSLFYLFRKLRSAIAEGFKNLQQFNGGANPVATTMNELSTSLTTLKNAWAAAFSPILQFVAPILQTLINMLVSAANAIGQFFAALGGQSKVIRATKAQQNLGKAIGGTGAAADKAKGQLAAFDELNLLDQDSGSGGGGGGGAGIGNMDFEEVDVESKFKDLVDKIKESWANADFTELGTMLGEKIKAGLDIAYEWLTGPIQDFAWRLAKSLATFFNGIIEVPQLGTSIGKVIGAALNDGFLFVNTFLKEFHWDSLGKLVGETIQAGFREFDWGNISTFVTRKFIAIFDSIRGFVQGIDWKAVPKDIWDAFVEFIQGIDITALATSFGQLLGAIVSGVANFGIGVWEGILELAFNVGEYFDKYIKEAEQMGADWMAGIFFGIVEAIGDAAKWIWDNVCKPLVDGFKEFFRIGSPSKLMEELGGDVMQGLFNGINSLIDSIIEIWENLKNKVVEIVKDLGAKIKAKWDEIKTNVSNVVNTLRTNLSTTWNNIKTTISTTVEGLKTAVSEKFNNIKTKLLDIANSIKTGLSNAFNAVKSTVTSIFNGMKSAVTDAFSGMWNGIRRVVNSILSGIETMANGVVDGINRIITSLNGLSFDIPDWVPKGLGGGKSFGVHLNTIGRISLPRLAQGAVIPPNKEFLAMLGDQSSGVNIEAPLDTIKEAFREVIGEGGATDEEMVQLLRELIDVVRTKNVSISRREVGDAAISEINGRTRRTGNTPLIG